MTFKIYTQIRAKTAYKNELKLENKTMLKHEFQSKINYQGRFRARYLPGEMPTYFLNILEKKQWS